MRNYKREYKMRSKKSKDDRQYRAKARTLMKKLRGAKTIKGKDIDHKDGNPRNNSRKNLRVRSIRLNRAKK